MKAIYAFARRLFGVSAFILLFMASMAAFDVPADLPGWRKLLGFALLCSGALVFEKFATDGKE
jgi:hypothetical protein